MGNTIKTFKISYVFLPVLIGLVVVSWLFYRDFNPELFSGLHFSWRMCGGILLAFVRQLILWIVMTVSPTPGGSGVSEYMFRVYYADFFTIGGMALLVAFIWRMITYYMYLFIGVCILPGWLRKLKM